MRWTVHGERTLYDSEWVRLTLVDVEKPGGERFEHHVVRTPCDAAGVAVVDPERGILLLWRHRFIHDTWGWEIPAGRVDPGEEPAGAASREVLEETGWQPGPLSPLLSYAPAIGLIDHLFHLFVAEGASHVGEPSDPYESERVAWVPLDEARRHLADGLIRCGMTTTALLLVGERLRITGDGDPSRSTKQ